MHTGQQREPVTGTRGPTDAEPSILASRRTNLRRFPGSIVSLLVTALLAAAVALAHSAPAHAFVACVGTPHLSNGPNNGTTNALPDNWYFDPDTVTCGSADSGFGLNRGFSHPERWTIGNGPLGGFRIATDDDDLSIAEAYPGMDAEGNNTPGVGRNGSNRRAQAFTSCHSKLLRLDDPDPVTNGNGSYLDDWDNTAYRVCGVGGGARYQSAGGERYVIQLQFTGARDGITYTVITDVTAVDINQANQNNVNLEILEGRAGHFVHSMIVFGGAFGGPPNESVMRNFMLRRANILIDEEPDLAGRLTGDFGNVTANNLLGVAGGGQKDNFDLSFQTSLRAITEVERAASDAAMAEFQEGHEGFSASGDALSKFDVWVKGKFIHSDADEWHSNIGLFYLGADYRFNDDLLFGVMGQFDWTREKTDTHEYPVDQHIEVHGPGHFSEGTETSGIGWMAGPYAAMRITDNLYIDGRGAYGASYNEINRFPFLSGKQEFDTKRWLVRAQVTGRFPATIGETTLSISPFVRGVYFQEETDGISEAPPWQVGAEKIKIARLTFGPKVSTQFTTSSGHRFAPYATFSGSWDASRTGEQIDSSGAVVDVSDWNARFESGLAWTWPNLFTLRGEAFVSGIALSDTRTYGGSLTVSIPLN